MARPAAFAVAGKRDPPDLGHQAYHDGDYSDRPWVPQVECAGCGRKVACIRVSDGTIYRPFAWVFSDEAQPLRGLCGGCKAKPMSYADIREAKERFKANSKLPIEAYCTKCGRVDRVYVLGDGSRVTSHVCSSCR